MPHALSNGRFQLFPSLSQSFFARIVVIVRCRLLEIEHDWNVITVHSDSMQLQFHSGFKYYESVLYTDGIVAHEVIGVKMDLQQLYVLKPKHFVIICANVTSKMILPHVARQFRVCISRKRAYRAFGVEFHVGAEIRGCVGLYLGRKDAIGLLADRAESETMDCVEMVAQFGGRCRYLVADTAAIRMQPTDFLENCWMAIKQVKFAAMVVVFHQLQAVV
jgi:hypothetical protein